VTMVSSDVLRQRRPVMNAMVNASDPDIARRVASERVATDAAPAAPARRVVTSAVIPPAPGRVLDPRGRYPQLRENMRQPGESPLVSTRPPSAARPGGPAPREAPVVRQVPQGGESQANESVARRPEMRVHQRPDMREPMPDSRPRPAPSARAPSPQAAQGETTRNAPAQRQAMPAAPEVPVAPVMPDARPVAPRPEVVQSSRPGARTVAPDERGGPPQGAGNSGNGGNGSNGNPGRGPRQQER
jgi:hypothetical protein